MSRSALISTLALGLAAMALPAAAEPGSVSEVTVQGVQPRSDVEIRSQVVFARDLDLSTHAGARTLFRRIRAAAQDVCAPQPSAVKDLGDAADYQRCTDQAIGLALREVPAPQVAEEYTALR